MANAKNLVKSDVDEKNIDEEISKVKEKLTAKIAERAKSKASISRSAGDDDDFFNAAVPDLGPRSGRTSGNGFSDDEMDVVNSGHKDNRKRAADELSDGDDIMKIPTTKKARIASGKSTMTSTARSRQSSGTSNPPLPRPRKTPTRAAASRAKKASSDF